MGFLTLGIGHGAWGIVKRLGDKENWGQGERKDLLQVLTLVTLSPLSPLLPHLPTPHQYKDSPNIQDIIKCSRS